MKKISFLFLIVLATLFVSCSKEDATISEKLEISYSDTIEIYSDDSQSSAIVVVSTNDKESFEETKSSLMLITELDSSGFTNATNTSDSISIDSDPGIEVFIDIVKINSTFKTIGFGHKDMGLKSYTTEQPSKHTYEYTCIESDADMFARYIDNPNSSKGVAGRFGKKECMLCGWDYPSSIDFWWYGSGQTGYYAANPSNGLSHVWKLGVKITTDLGKDDNYTVYLELK